jgi:transposase-like protein
MKQHGPWTWLQKLRSLMIRPGRELLRGEVEVNETYIGGEEAGVVGRGAKNKFLVAVTVEVVNDKPGRVRFRCIKNASSEELIPFVIDNVDRNSLVITDGWKSYSSLKDKGYKHKVMNISKSGKDANELLPRVHLIESLVKRWLMGTHQGAVSNRHLQYYLDEYSFRFNRRLSRHRSKLFYRIIQLAVCQEATTMDEITGKKSRHNI